MIPPAKGWHGEENAASATEWFYMSETNNWETTLDSNWNSTVSPTAAVTLLGLYVREPPGATWTTKFAARTATISEKKIPRSITHGDTAQRWAFIYTATRCQPHQNGAHNHSLPRSLVKLTKAWLRGVHNGNSWSEDPRTSPSVKTCSDSGCLNMLPQHI